MRKKTHAPKIACEKDPSEKLCPVAEVATAIRNLADCINTEPNIHFKVITASRDLRGPFFGSHFHTSSEIMKAIRALEAAMIAAAYKKQILPERISDIRTLLYQIESQIAQGKLSADFFDKIR